MDPNFKVAGRFVCGECSIDKPVSEKTFIGSIAFNKHYTKHHDPMDTYRCNQGGCKKVMLDKTSLIRHITSYHKDLLLTGSWEPRAGPSNIDVDPANPSSGHEMERDEDMLSICLEGDRSPPSSPSQPSTSEPQPVLSLQEQINQAAVRMLLGLRSTASLTGKAIERFQHGCYQMIQQVCSGIKNVVSKRLIEKGLSVEDAEDVLRDVEDLSDPFENLRTIDDQLKYFSEKYGLVIPKEKFLDSRIDNRLDPNSCSYVPTQVTETFQYIPIIDTLKSILSDEKVRSKILEDQSSKDGVLRSYMDGSLFKEHPYLRRHKNVILILLYFDELEIANALGSKTIIHKLGAFFFQILNLPPEVSSQLSTIHLLALAYADDLKKENALKKVLTPLVHEMKKLSSEEGVEIGVDGEQFTLRAVLTALTADTPAAHDVLGFIAPQGAKHFCRLCMVSRSEIRADANALGTPRTKEMHAYHLEEVSRLSKFSTQCGVKRDCPLNQIPYFHCVENSVLDAFHDFLEGIVPFVIKLVLRRYIIKEKKFTVQDFNGIIASFDYGTPDSKNKPSANFTTEMLYSGSGKLKQTGSQLWCLMRAFPFLVSKFIPNVDEYMEQIFLLQDILQIVFSFEVRVEDIDRLEILTSKHNELFQKLFVDTQDNNRDEQDAEQEEEEDEAVEEEEEDEAVEEEEGQEECDEDEEDEESAEIEEEETPEEEMSVEEPGTSSGSRAEKKKKMPSKVYITNKLHQAKHYAELMRKFGPAVRMWCAKFEGRLKIFRQHSAICCNFKNPPKTQAQMFQLSNVQGLSQALERSVEFQKGGPSVKVSECQLRAKLITEGLSESDDITFCKSALFNGEEYRQGLFVCLPNSTTFQPAFAMIKDVIVSPKALHLCVVPWKNCGLDRRYNTFRAAPDADAEAAVLNVLKLANFRCMAPWTIDATQVFISMRTILM